MINLINLINSLMIIVSIVLIVSSCGTVMIDNKVNSILINPIVDSGGKLHDYKKSVKFELYKDYGLFCIVHYNWERIGVRYAKKDSTGQLNRTEYIVRVIK